MCDSLCAQSAYSRGFNIPRTREKPLHAAVNRGGGEWDSYFKPMLDYKTGDKMIPKELLGRVPPGRTADEDENRYKIAKALLSQPGPRRAKQWFNVYIGQGRPTDGVCVKEPQHLIRWEPLLWAIANKYVPLTRLLLAAAEKWHDLDRPSHSQKMNWWGRPRQLQCLREAAELVVPKPPAVMFELIDAYAAKRPEDVKN